MSSTSDISDTSNDEFYSRIGGENDLIAKQILLNIEDDDKMVAVCMTSKAMQEVCKQPDLWKERLEKYYPKYIGMKKKLDLDWNIFYPIASRLNKIAELKGDYQGDEYVMIARQEMLEKIERRLGKYLSEIELDYSLLFNKKFQEKYGLDIAFILGEYLLQQGEHEKFKSLKLEDISTDKYQVLLSQFMPIDFIFDIYYEEELLVTMYKYYSKFTNVRAIEFIKIFNQKFGMSERNFTIFLTFAVYQNLLTTADWLLENFSNLSSVINKSNFNVSDILTIDELRVSLQIPQDEDQDDYQAREMYEQLSIFITFMITRNIKPNFNLLLPTNELLQSSFIQDTFDHDNIDDEENDDNNQNNEVVIEEKDRLKAYDSLITLSALEYLLKLFAMANMKPSSNTINALSPKIKEFYPQFYKYLPFSN